MIHAAPRTAGLPSTITRMWFRLKTAKGGHAKTQTSQSLCA